MLMTGTGTDVGGGGGGGGTIGDGVSPHDDSGRSIAATSEAVRRSLRAIWIDFRRRNSPDLSLLLA